MKNHLIFNKCKVSLYAYDRKNNYIITYGVLNAKINSRVKFDSPEATVRQFTLIGDIVDAPKLRKRKREE